MLSPQMPPKNGVEQFDYPHGEFRFMQDMRYFPLVMCRTYGKMTYESLRIVYTMRDVEAYWAVKHNTQIFWVWDVQETLPPDAINRKKLADLAQQAQIIDGFINTVIVVKNPLLRGVVTAIKWMMGDGIPLEVASDEKTAFDVARRRFEQYGINSPNVPNDFRLAAWDDTLETTRIKPSDLWWNVENRDQLLKQVIP